MKTRCPYCSKVLSVPDKYEGKRIRCKGCNGILTAISLALQAKPEPSSTHHELTNEEPKATDWQPQSPVVPLPPATQPNFLIRIWQGTPLAFRTAFLATLGVIAALWLTWYLSGLSTRLQKPEVAESPIASYKDTISDSQLYSVPLSIRGTGNELRTLCEIYGWLEMGAALKTISLSEDTRSNIIGLLNYNLKLLNAGDMAPPLEEARDALVDAIKAEIAVLNFEKQHTKMKKHESLLDNQDFVRLIERSMSLRGEAASQIDKLMYKI